MCAIKKLVSLAIYIATLLGLLVVMEQAVHPTVDDLAALLGTLPLTVLREIAKILPCHVRARLRDVFQQKFTEDEMKRYDVICMRWTPFPEKLWPGVPRLEYNLTECARKGHLKCLDYLVKQGLQVPSHVVYTSCKLRVSDHTPVFGFHWLRV